MQVMEVALVARCAHVPSRYSLRSIAYTSIKPLRMRVFPDRLQHKKRSLSERGFLLSQSKQGRIDYGETQSGGVSSSKSLSICLAISPSVILSPIANCM